MGIADPGMELDATGALENMASSSLESSALYLISVRVVILSVRN